MNSSLEDAFESFKMTPVGTGTLCTVHEAVSRSGGRVAVKVVRPEIRFEVAADLASFQTMVRLLGGLLPPLDIRIPALVHGLSHQLAAELDLSVEAYWLRRAAGAANGQVVVPGVSASPGPDVLILEHLRSAPLFESVRSPRVNGRVFRSLMQFWLASALSEGVVHGDMHAGNVRMLPSGAVAVLDWGSTFKLSQAGRSLLAGLVRAGTGDAIGWGDVVEHFVASTRTSGTSAEELAVRVRARLEPLLTRPLGTVDLTATAPGSSTPGLLDWETLNLLKQLIYLASIGSCLDPGETLFGSPG